MKVADEMVSRQPVLRGDNTYFLLNLQKTTGNALPVVFHFWQGPFLAELTTFAAYPPGRCGCTDSDIRAERVSLKSQCREKRPV